MADLGINGDAIVQPVHGRDLWAAAILFKLAGTGVQDRKIIEPETEVQLSATEVDDS